MYVRVKRIGSKRYVYLAEGVSENGHVRQKTLSYLGPITRVASGIPNDNRRRVEQKIGAVDWNKVNMGLRRIPLEFEEVEEMKREWLPKVLARRWKAARDVGRGNRPRAEGELTALIRMSRNSFNRLFETLADGTLVMR